MALGVLEGCLVLLIESSSEGQVDESPAPKPVMLVYSSALCLRRRRLTV